MSDPARCILNWTFLKWYVDPRNPQAARETFIALGEEEDGTEKQKSLLAQLLDKNHLYVNASEMDDTDLAISEQDKALTWEFMGGKP